MNRNIDILQVEDQQSDAALTAYALQKSGLNYSIRVVGDGKQAIDLLRLTANEPGSLPDLVLLDLNLPIVDGHEVLRQVKTDPALMSIPVVMFSTSEEHESRRLAYELHANSYVVKPSELHAFVAAVKSIVTYWASTVNLPNSGN
jgi:two-component system, chemotaxis family, response regulator Rcp1